MSKRLDHIIVIDIESTCWDGGMPPRGDRAELTDAEIRNAILYMYNPGGK